MRSFAIAAALLALATSSRAAEPPPDKTWRVELERSTFGPLAVLATATPTSADGFVLRSSSGALSLIRQMPGARGPVVRIDDALWSFEFRREGEGWRGASVASRRGDGATLTIRPDGAVSGNIEAGWFRGPLRASPTQDAAPLRDYAAVVEALDGVVAASIYDPGLVRSEPYRGYIEGLRKVAALSRDDLDLLVASRWSWPEAPGASHFELRRSAIPAADLAKGFDAIRVGGREVVLEHGDGVSVLTVSTMMGTDTYEQIGAAWAGIIDRDPPAVIIDLRGNPGGAFAVQPLVAPLVRAPRDIGVFVSRKGVNGAPAPPGRAAMVASPAFDGTSLVGFWREVQASPRLKVTARPAARSYGGRVFVLVNSRTASAAEMAAHALRGAGARLVGERTAGRMLSGAYFDLPEGFQAYVPIADYYAEGEVRIEGRGLTPDLPVAGADAKDAALAAIRAGR